MTDIAEILDPAALEVQIAGGLITRRRLAGTSIVVYNYTARAASKNLWTVETVHCRGLVVDEASGVVLARPFAKFFDLDHTSVPTGGPIVASEKVDGSLGVLYRRSDGWAITTRGDPNSWQAAAATELWRNRHGSVTPPDGVTWLFEIVLPENRVVVDYGERRELIGLAAIDIATGRDIGLPQGFDGPMAERVDCSDGHLAEILGEMERQGNREGLVLLWPDDNVRAKVKLAAYTRLHRLLFATSTKTVWEALVAGDDPLAGYDNTPDELRAFVAERAQRMRRRHEQLVAEAEAFVDRLGPQVRADRRLAAQEIKKAAQPGLCFLALDGHTQGLRDAAWKLVRPARAEMFATEDETND